MINLIIPFRRVRDMREDNILHSLREIDTEPIVPLRKAQILLTRPIILLRIARDDEMGHHPRHQQPNRRVALRLAVDVLDIGGLGDGAGHVADVAEMVDGQVAQRDGAELEAEKVEVEHGDGVGELVGDGVGEFVVVEPLGEELQAVCGPRLHGEDFDFVAQEGCEEGDVVAEEFGVDGERVAGGSALDADEWALEETVCGDWLELGVLICLVGVDVPSERWGRSHWKR